MALCSKQALAAKAVTRSVVAVPALRPARKSAVRVSAQVGFVFLVSR
jgi:hypothetical protein